MLERSTNLRKPRRPARGLRFIYKLKGPEACNFLVSFDVAAELDALTVEQIKDEFQERCGRRWRGVAWRGVACEKTGSGAVRLRYACRRAEAQASKLTGVTFNQHEGRWQARVSVALDGGQTKQASLAMGSSASEEQAAERVSAGAYVLGDRCVQLSARMRAVMARHSAHRGGGGRACGCAGARPRCPWAASSTWRLRKVRHVAHADLGPDAAAPLLRVWPPCARCACRAGAGRGGAGGGQGAAAGGADAYPPASEAELRRNRQGSLERVCSVKASC